MPVTLVREEPLGRHGRQKGHWGAPAKDSGCGNIIIIIIRERERVMRESGCVISSRVIILTDFFD